ncbi:hypothetical protein T01_12627 [Trichinella spiralis]|uniref:Uncharacterized protein n=1 Tax=Trichinella spiralis TaxID=6334 RepID=A0A0V1B9N2_TRISP|nr:hypothetical protein T01_12627 [Trichinella spiralis]
MKKYNKTSLDEALIFMTSAFYKLDIVALKENDISSQNSTDSTEHHPCSDPQITKAESGV